MSTELPPTLLPKITSFVTNCMKSHDPSHNPAHIHRVVSLALSILKSEQQQPNPKTYDPTIVHLAALLHDIGDRKYLPQIQAAATATATATSTSTSTSTSTPKESESEKERQIEQIPPTKLVETALLSHGASPPLAQKIQVIVSHVSYTTERANPERVRRLIEEEGYPELAIVQDADRLDALGAVGIGRCFTFLGTRGGEIAAASSGGRWEMENAIGHFGDKLERLEGMMKTKTGRVMARRRTERLRVFRGWWEEEMREVEGGI